eukprot:5905206-Prymnesium_polylepis.1
MLSDVGPSSKAHSACSPTPWEVTTAGSRAVDKRELARVLEPRTLYFEVVQIFPGPGGPFPINQKLVPSRTSID